MKIWTGGLLAVVLLSGLIAITAGPLGAQPSPNDIGISPVLVIVEGADFIGADSPQFISGQDWVVDDLIDLYINEAFFGTSIAEPNAEGSASPFFDINSSGVYVSAGDEIKFVRSSDGRTEVHVVTDLAVGVVSAKRDTVAGTAAPGSEIFVGPAPGEMIGRFETTDADGDWLADFSKSPGGFDIVSATVGLAFEFDADLNATVAWFAPTVSDKAQCKKGGWIDFGVFANQGDCIRNAG